MILSNAAILEALGDGRLVIEPAPEPGSGQGSPFGTSSIDLRLGRVLARPRELPHAVIDFGRSGRVGDTLSGAMDEFEIGEDGYDLEPGPENLILGHTLEEVRLPCLRTSARVRTASRLLPPASRARAPARASGCWCTSPRRPSTPVGPGGSPSK